MKTTKCSNCMNWERPEPPQPNRGRGYCQIFDRVTTSNQGDRCFACEPWPGEAIAELKASAEPSDEKSDRKLTAEILYKSDLFDYLCWLESEHTKDNPEVKDCPYMILASDNTTCWGETYADAVKVAMNHDKGIADDKLKPSALPSNK